MRHINRIAENRKKYLVVFQINNINQQDNCKVYGNRMYRAITSYFKSKR